MIAEHARDLGQLGEVPDALAAVARAQGDRAGVVAELRAAAVPLDLQRPVLAFGSAPVVSSIGAMNLG
jgi:hypothetical protein